MPEISLCVCCHLIYSGRRTCGHTTTSRDNTGERSNKISPAIPSFLRRPFRQILCTDEWSLVPNFGMIFLFFCFYFIVFYFMFHLTYNRWASLPSCLWSRSLRIFPSLPGSRFTNFYRETSSALLQHVNQWLNFLYAFRYGCQNKNPA